MSTEIGAWFTVGQAASIIGTHLAATDPEAGIRWLERGDDAARRSGDPFVIGFNGMGWSLALGYLGRLDEARARAEVALARFREIGDLRMQLVVRSNLSHALRRAGHFEETLAEYRQTIVEWQRLGQRGAVANQLENFAFVALAQGRDRRAATLIGAADRLRVASASVMLSIEQVEYDEAVDLLRERLGEAALEQARTEGRGLTTEQAVALARSD